MKNFFLFPTFFLLSLTLSCASCGPKNYHPPTDTDNCAPACTRLQEMGCEEGNDLIGLNGEVTSCTKWCEDTQKEGHGLNPTFILDPEKFQTCEDIDKTGD